ncbi:MAG: hypothetical protein V7L21_34355 [Nostoc sp.]|uniref:hypothetical protein n=1 Tax=unclassified Nostoc TaxID=2593658 RepID=UPI0025FC45CF|nr:hypothetical protein [Nostoc sp. NMS9]MBN3939159.1 hypothetical protein [Nostoc sp. NMS9]
MVNLYYDRERAIANEIRMSAAKIAWSLRTIFNSPEATASLRGINQQEAHSRRVLEYCVDGCLQSVLDEYAHILRESLGLLNKDSIYV